MRKYSQQRPKVTPGQINVTGDGCGDGISVGTVEGNYEKEEKKRERNEENTKTPESLIQ